MPYTTFARILQIAFAISIILGLSSCVVYDRPYGPGYGRPVPPAAGVVYYDYWYYPDAQVYFDVNRRVYFYFSNQRWVETRVLPTYWQSKLHNYVPIHSQHQRPYIEYKEHSHKYPPRYREGYRERERYEQRNDPHYRNELYPNRYQEMPRKEPPRTWQSGPALQERDNYRQPHSSFNDKQPVRQGYQEMPRGDASTGVKSRLPVKETAKDKKNGKHNTDKNKKSKHAKDQDQQDDGDQYRDRRDYRN